MSNTFIGTLLIGMPQGASEWLVFMFAVALMCLPIWILYWVFKYVTNRKTGY